jgi:hypothetical protein
MATKIEVCGWCKKRGRCSTQEKIICDEYRKASSDEVKYIPVVIQITV